MTMTKLSLLHTFSLMIPYWRRGVSSFCLFVFLSLAASFPAAAAEADNIDSEVSQRNPSKATIDAISDAIWRLQTTLGHGDENADAIFEPYDTKSDFDGDTEPESDGDIKFDFDGDTKPESDGDTKPESDGDIKFDFDGDTKPESDGDTINSAIRSTCGDALCLPSRTPGGVVKTYSLFDAGLAGNSLPLEQCSNAIPALMSMLTGDMESPSIYWKYGRHGVDGSNSPSLSPVMHVVDEVTDVAASMITTGLKILGLWISQKNTKSDTECLFHENCSLAVDRPIGQNSEKNQHPFAFLTYENVNGVLKSGIRYLSKIWDKSIPAKTIVTMNDASSNRYRRSSDEHISPVTSNSETTTEPPSKKQEEVPMFPPNVNVGSFLCENIVGLEGYVHPSMCATINAVYTAALCRYAYPARCKARRSVVVPPGTDDLPLQNFFRDGTRVPMYIPLKTIAEEGPTYAHIWELSRYVSYIGNGVECGRTKSSEELEPLSEIWKTEHIIYTLEPGEPKREVLPLTFIMRNGRQVLILTRGLLTLTEMSFCIKPNLIESDMWTGKVLEGFGKISQFIYPTIKSYLENAVEEHSISRVIVSGFSLGAAVSSIISYTIRQQFPDLDLSALLYSTPRVGDAEFAEAVSRSVNLRNIKFSLDLLTELPCRRTAKCDFGPWIFYTKEVEVSVLSDLPGIIKFYPNDLPNSYWSQNPLTSNLRLSANHSCATTCFLSRRYNREQTATQCHSTPDNGCPYLTR